MQQLLDIQFASQVRLHENQELRHADDDEDCDEAAEEAAASSHCEDWACPCWLGHARPHGATWTGSQIT